MTATDNDRSYWERHARRYDLSLVALKRPFPRMLELVRDAVSGADRVLEVAAGTGLVTSVLSRAAKRVVATDYAASMIEVLEAKVRGEGLRNVHCQQADLYALPFEPGSFDAVVAANVLHLVPDLPRALSALRRVLRPEGCLVVPTFCHDETALSRTVSRLLAVTGFPGHRRFTASSLRESLESAGLNARQPVILPGLIPIGYADGKFKSA